MSEIEPEAWDDIIDSDDAPRGSIVGPGRQWAEFFGAMRAYDETIYVQIDDGWVAFGDVVAALNDLLETSGGDGQ